MGIDLGKEYGPLPLGAWIALVGGGLGIAVYAQRNSATPPPTVVSDPSGDPNVGTGSVGGWTATTPDVATGAVDATNEAWTTDAINYLIGQGYAPALSTSAITKWIGDTGMLSVQEKTLVDIALKAKGSPPNPPSNANPLPPTPVPGPVQQKITAKVANFHVHEVGKTTVSISWNNLPGAAMYYVYLTGRAGQIFAKDNQATFTNLSPGTKYSFKVRAVNAAGMGPLSGTISATTKK